jgi:ferredoxin
MHSVLTSITSAAFTPLAWFAPNAEDGFPDGVQFVILIGNAGPSMFHRFASERDVRHDALDDWTRESVSALARTLDTTAVFPFDIPYPPMLTWARKGGGGHQSPLGLNIHPVYGLWHAYRAALLFPVAFDLPSPAIVPHPCESCSAKPCLTACPVGAFSGDSYDYPRCVRHVASPEGARCFDGGCLARHACPVGQSFTYEPQQAQFHMRATVKAGKARGI